MRQLQPAPSRPPVRRRLASALKQLTMRFGRPIPAYSFMLPNTQFNFRKEVGDGTRSSTVMAPLWWIMRTFPEAPIALASEMPDGERDPVPVHPMLDLISSPNRHYSGTVLWMATMLDLNATGDSYWLIERDGQLRPFALWWVPSWTMRPITPDDGSDLLSHYEYRPRGREMMTVEVDEVVHFRYGIDPEDPRRGLSPLASVLREVFTDDEAANFTASLLRNMGVPGLLVAPKSDVAVSDDDLKAAKKEFQSRFIGDRRGEPFVASGPTDLTQFGFSPKEMEMRDLRRIPEERTTAALGVPAIVAGLGAGLDRSTFSNMREAREMAYETTIIPLQRLAATDIKTQLLPHYEPDPQRFWVGFDHSEVRVLQEDENQRVERLVKELHAGAITVAEYRRETGREALPEHDIYLRPINLVETPTGPRPLGGEGAAARLGTGLKGTPAQDRLIEAINRDQERLAGAMETELFSRFEDLGTQAARLARAQGLTFEGQGTSSNGSDAHKAPTPEDRVAVRALMDGLNVDDWKERELRPVFERHYLRTLETTVSTTNEVMGLGLDLPDHVQRELVRTGGRRVGLLDMTGETRTGLFNALADGREAGEGVDQLARRVQHNVSAGRYRNAGPRYRAQMIARTETKYAQNVSATTSYKESPVVTGLLAYDAQGPTSDPECEARDGVIFSFDDADTETQLEHPNGTLSWAPVTREGAIST